MNSNCEKEILGLHAESLDATKLVAVTTKGCYDMILKTTNEKKKKEKRRFDI